MNFFDYTNVLEVNKEDEIIEKPLDAEIKTSEVTIKSKRVRLRGKIINKEKYVSVRRVSDKTSEGTISEEKKETDYYTDVTTTFKHYLKTNKRNCNIKGVRFHVNNSVEDSKTFEFKIEKCGPVSFMHVSVSSSNDNFKIFEKVKNTLQKMNLVCTSCGKIMHLGEINKETTLCQNQ